MMPLYFSRSFRYVSVVALIFITSGCGKITSQNQGVIAVSQQPTFSYPFHLGLTVDVPVNAVSHILADVWGVAEVDRATGAVTGEGVIRYSVDTSCAWIPPSPGEGVAPYCTVDALREGSFFISGSVKEYTESRYAEDLSDMDKLLFASGDAWGFEQAEWLPRVIELNFDYGDLPMEEVTLSGFTGGGVEEKELGGLAMGLDAVGFVRPFTISPIMAPSTNDPVYAQVGSSAQFLFSGDNGIASGQGTLFFVDALPY